jgi:hypothetical protein
MRHNLPRKEVCIKPGMVQIPFGGMGKPVNTAGFSDHFPIAMTVQDAD